MSDLTMSGREPGAEAPGKRLESWKEIAAYLGRDVTTARRWEKREGLPVRRLHHIKLGSVYAYAAELDTWRNNRASGASSGGTDAPSAARPAARTARVIALALLGVALTGGVAWFSRDGATTPPTSVRSLAVLPLENFSGNEAQDYLADGMTEALITRLSAIHGLRVISRTSVMQFKGTRKPVSAIATELRVDAVVEGSVLRSGSQIRINVQLIRGATDEHLWSRTYDRELRDVLALQSEVAHGIASEIETTVTGKEKKRLVAPRTVSPGVYESYLKGRFALHKNSRDGLVEAVALFERAFDEDPTFAPAYAGLATAHNRLGTVFYGEPRETAKVMAVVEKALELDPELVEARVVLADVLQKDWRWAEAEAEFKRALESNPSDALAHVGFARWLLCHGRTQEALAWAERGRELDPLALIGTEIGWILFHSRRYEDAIRELKSVLAVEPGHPLALWFLGFALIEAARFDEAIATLERAASDSNRRPAVLGVLTRAYARGGRRREALVTLEELHRMQQEGYVPAAAFVNAYLGLGDRERAFAWLERASRERSSILQFLKVHPFFDPLRSDPRFAELLRRANLG
jgi:TolB-like protein/tetratricopeptide (TPR) repeat protein